LLPRPEDCGEQLDKIITYLSVPELEKESSNLMQKRDGPPLGFPDGRLYHQLFNPKCLSSQVLVGLCLSKAQNMIPQMTPTRLAVEEMIV
jgi:hypothetical protein